MRREGHYVGRRAMEMKVQGEGREEDQIEMDEQSKRAKTIKKNTNSTPNKSQTHRAKHYEVTSFLSTDCELSTVYSIGPRMISKRRDCRLMKCMTVLHGGVCHRTSSQIEVGIDEGEEEEEERPMHSMRCLLCGHGKRK